MDPLVKTLMETWQMLSMEVIRLNDSANNMIAVERELALRPYLMEELMEDIDESPFAVIAVMKRDRLTLRTQLSELAATINAAKNQFSDSPESTELENASHNTQVILQFLDKIDVDGIEASLQNLMKEQ